MILNIDPKLLAFFFVFFCSSLKKHSNINFSVRGGVDLGFHPAIVDSTTPQSLRAVRYQAIPYRAFECVEECYFICLMINKGHYIFKTVKNLYPVRVVI